VPYISGEGTSQRKDQTPGHSTAGHMSGADRPPGQQDLNARQMPAHTPSATVAHRRRAFPRQARPRVQGHEVVVHYAIARLASGDWDSPVGDHAGPGCEVSRRTYHHQKGGTG